METGVQGGGVLPERKRAWGTWVAIVVALICLGVILVFILENSKEVPVELFGASVRMPIGVAILFGVILGGVLVALVGAVRLFQIRARKPKDSVESPD
jgi:uncharacterized integral membrane protein